MRRLIAITMGIFLSSAASAQETTTYSYDALGRLVTSQISGGANNGTQTDIGYDPAGNRTTYAVGGSTTSANGDPNAAGTVSRQPMVIVVPLNGFTIIPINQ